MVTCSHCLVFVQYWANHYGTMITYMGQSFQMIKEIFMKQRFSSIDSLLYTWHGRCLLFSTLNHMYFCPETRYRIIGPILIFTAFWLKSLFCPDPNFGYQLMIRVEKNIYFINFTVCGMWQDIFEVNNNLVKLMKSNCIYTLFLLRVWNLLPGSLTERNFHATDIKCDKDP